MGNYIDKDKLISAIKQELVECEIDRFRGLLTSEQIIESMQTEDVIPVMLRRGVERMKITDERVKYILKKFSEVEIGQVFSSGGIYLKISTDTAYSFDLKSTMLFDTTQYVNELNAELLIHPTEQ